MSISTLSRGIPQEFPGILRELSQEILWHSPKDPVQFAADYFASLSAQGTCHLCRSLPYDEASRFADDNNDQTTEENKYAEVIGDDVQVADEAPHTQWHDVDGHDSAKAEEELEELKHASAAAQTIQVQYRYYAKKKKKGSQQQQEEEAVVPDKMEVVEYEDAEAAAAAAQSIQVQYRYYVKKKTRASAAAAAESKAAVAEEEEFVYSDEDRASRAAQSIQVGYRYSKRKQRASQQQQVEEENNITDLTTGPVAAVAQEEEEETFDEIDNDPKAAAAAQSIQVHYRYHAKQVKKKVYNAEKQNAQEFKNALDEITPKVTKRRSSLGESTSHRNTLIEAHNVNLVGIEMPSQTVA